VLIDLVAEEIALGHVRPSLLYQIEHGLEEPLLLPRRARLLDRTFLPAHRQARARPSVSWRPVLGALVRRVGRWSRELKAGMAPSR
jgi:hypothetical protein